MTSAAFQATFSDFKLIKGRKCAQIILEVPIEGADAALNALGGLPRPDQEAWVAVARIDQKAASGARGAQGTPPARDNTERRACNDLSAVQQAGIRCNEKAFWRFLETLRFGLRVLSADHAAELVRDSCGVASRSEFRPNTPAEKRWQFIEAAYQGWLAKEERVG